jgi:diguanylate cyclase (GGDEF)-like protein
MSKKTNTDLFFNKASNYPLQSFRLEGKGQDTLGLLLVADNCSGHEIESAVANLGLSTKKPEKNPTIEEDDNPGQHDLHQLLTIELDRVHRTKLPCALLLLDLSKKSISKKQKEQIMTQAVAPLGSILHQIDIFSLDGQDHFAFILPGTNVGKARKRAQEIQQTIGQTNFSLANQKITPTATMGIAICHAYDTLSASQLIDMAEEELNRALKKGPDAICHYSASRQEDSCQVTVEERAQLFSFLQKDTAS